MPDLPQQHPLAGLQIVDFTHVLAGPACSYYLGLLGAEVIKVESIGKDDAMRHRGGTDAFATSRAMSTAYLIPAVFATDSWLALKNMSFQHVTNI